MMAYNLLYIYILLYLIIYYIKLQIVWRIQSSMKYYFYFFKWYIYIIHDMHQFQVKCFESIEKNREFKACRQEILSIGEKFILQEVGTGLCDDD